MEYKGYSAVYEYEAEDRVFHGRVAGIRDLVTFVASRAEDVEHEFQQSVDFYLDHCARTGHEPNRPHAPNDATE